MKKNKGENQMKLKRLEIKKLHNLYDYELDFNKNINILFGKNGCGKTTLLNIITYIISGKIYKLIKYQFEYVKLEFLNNKNKCEEINIFYEDEKICIKYNEEKVRKIDKNEFNEIPPYYRENFEESENFWKKYEIFSKIKEIFNIVYLPLTRDYRELDNDDYEIMKLPRRKYERIKYSYLDKALENVQTLVIDELAKLTEELNKLESNFKYEIIEIMFSNTKEITIEDREINEEEKNFIIDNIKRFNLCNEQLEKKINDFCKQYNIAYKKYQTIQKNYKSSLKEGHIDYDEQLDLLNELLTAKNDIISKNTTRKQFEELRRKIEEYNKKIREIMKPIEKFENITNNFFINSSISKKINIGYRKIYFTTQNQERLIELSDLSSGEKQIIIFLAYFIFGVLPAEQPIFIVDEPEMSLHLMWQKNWISSIEELNPDIQLIIATHSPEIVGKYRKNMIKIEPREEE